MHSTVKKIHVACGQIVCRHGDIAANIRQIKRLAEDAAKAGAKFVLFGEGAMNGYIFRRDFVRRHAVSADGPQARSLHALSSKLGIVIAAGAIERAGDLFYVSHFIVFPNGRLLIQRKHNLTEDEKKGGISAGPEERLIFSVGGVRFGICICADSGIPDIWNKLADAGCQVYCGPCAGGAGREHMRRPQDLKDAKKRKKYLEDMEKVCFAGKTIFECHDRRMAMMAVNLAGDDGVSKYHPGHSMIFDSRGHVVALMPGEYVAEYLSPAMIHGVITVQSPCKVTGKLPGRPAKSAKQ